MNLILGDGLLGSSVILTSGWQYISRKEHGFDINNINSWNSNISKDVTCIINLIANTDTYSKDIDAMFETNYRAVINLVDYCNDNKIKLVHYSTDYVYENSKPNASEVDKTAPTTPYAMSKVLADEYIMKHCNDYLILRGSQKIKPFPYPKAYVDVIGNFDYPDRIAELTIKMIERGATGLYNIGTHTKSMFELAKQTNAHVKPIEAPKHFPKDITMDLTKMNKFLKDK